VNLKDRAVLQRITKVASVLIADNQMLLVIMLSRQHSFSPVRGHIGCCFLQRRMYSRLLARCIPLGY
jgi:hypothetical protein